MRKILMLLVLATTFNCGALSKGCASFTGHDVTCVNGVKYIQFTSGASVMYNQDGTIKTCR